MKKQIVITMIILMSMLGFTRADAGVVHDSALNWYSMESEHFRIHFHDGEQQLAKKSLNIAESVHNKLSTEFDWQPLDKTEIMLTDELDVSNGMATPLPSNRMYLFTTPPDGVFGLEDHAGWLEMLILHEYVHILHIDKAAGGPKWLRKVFGRNMLLFPNMLQPSWLIEGLATYYETDNEFGIGRGQSSYFDMMMRIEVKSGVKPLSQVNQHVVSWPGGTIAYLYGVHFFQFIEERYGAESIGQLVENYSSNLLPFRIDSNAAEVTRRDLSTLWQEFNAYLNQKYQPQLSAIHQQGEVRGTALTQNGYFHGPVVVHPDGRLFYLANDGQSETALMVRDPGGKTKAISEVHSPARLDIHPEAGILLAQPEICRNARLHYDLFRIDPEHGEQQRLTHCSRYISASWSPDGKQIIAVQNRLGRHALHLLTALGTFKELLWQGEEGITVSQPDWSPNGDAIAASVWRKEHGWELELFQLSSRSWQRLSHDKAIEADPRYSNDGKQLLYSSDAGGIYNIKRLDLSSGKTVNISRVNGGAFQPYQNSVDSPVYYVGYNAKGFDIYKIDHIEGSVAIPENPGTNAVAWPKAENVTVSKATDYSPWSSLAPSSWFPYLNITSQQTEFGASIWGSDILKRHNYALLAGYDLKQKWANYTVAYSYARFDPLLKLYASTSSQAQYDGNNKLGRIARQQRYDAELVYPILDMDWSLNLHLGSSYVKVKDGWLANNIRPFNDLTDTLAGVAISWNSTSTHNRSISPSDGRDILLAAENSSVMATTDYRGNIFLGDWREYIGLSGEHVLALRAAMGWGTKSPRAFVLGGAHSTTGIAGLSSVRSVFNRRSFSLRGYGTSTTLTGRRMQLVSAEYRFPIKRVERGFMSPPIGLHQLSGSLFSDTGAAWNIGSSPAKYYVGLGAELAADTELFYNIPLRLTLGYAYGLDKTLGGSHLYLRLGNSF